MEKQSEKKISISRKQAVGLIIPYVKKRVLEQIRSVWLILTYLVLFQVIVLGIPIVDVGVITLGMLMVIIGLAFFLEGLILGLMPLGELIGISLPQRTKMAGIMLFSLILGVGVTIAEPAIGALKILGSGVQAWNAPLLYLLLNTYPHYLIAAIGLGVGIAVMIGMLRFLYGWSLKPFIYVIVPLLLALSIWAAFDPNLLYLTGLAWDCGAVTTGPVTVPMVLALGIGVTRIMSSKKNDNAAGLGVVTLASLMPIITVLLLGAALLGRVPAPLPESEFLSRENREKVRNMFPDDHSLIRYSFTKASPEGINSMLGSEAARTSFISEMSADPVKRENIFRDKTPAFKRWVAVNGSFAEKISLLGSIDAARDIIAGPCELTRFTLLPVLKSSFFASIQAIIPLTLFMLIVFLFVLRQKLPRKDEMLFGILMAVAGMSFFNVGMEAGLARLGNQVGAMLPASFASIAVEDKTEKIPNFSPEIVQKAVTSKGETEQFFFHRKDKHIETIPFIENNFDPVSSTYLHEPRIGPIFGSSEGSLTGIIVVLIFAFFMGYGATLAEPALNALGIKVEELTVGTFRKSFLMQAVGFGVGTGTAFGVAKIVWDVPLIWMIAPAYVLLIVLTKLSSEEYVNVGWDSAGVTTGPVTVPLVLALGLGIGMKTGAVEGFGILAMASACPIISVLVAGLYAKNKRKRILENSGIEPPGGPSK